MRAFSFGGGVQSTASLVLAAQGRIDYRVFLFSNVGNDSENPDTLSYVAQVAAPFSQQHGLELRELTRTTNNGETLYQRTVRETRSIKIPVRMKNGAPGGVRVISSWLIVLSIAVSRIRQACDGLVCRAQLMPQVYDFSLRLLQLGGHLADGLRPRLKRDGLKRVNERIREMQLRGVGGGVG